MELTPYIEALQKSLTAAAAPAGKDVAEAAALLSQALEASARLSLLDAMADAADEITTALNDVSVEVRLRSGAVEFIVDEIVHPSAAPVPTEPSKNESSDDIARISLRLPESLKDSVEQAAGTENISVNAWLVRAIVGAVDSGSTHTFQTGRTRLGRRFTGFAQA